MTIKLYYEDPYLKEAKANVLKVIEEEQKIIAILDKTIFYPEGGGQPADKGFIEDAEVLDVQEKGGEIYHYLNKPIAKGEVNCVIDFDRRFDHMQQHSGEHMLAATFHKLFKTESQGFHMGEEYSNLDLSLEELKDEDVSKVENIINKHIYENAAVETFFVNQEESKRLELRKRVENEDEIRIVKIGEIDACACCGTHIKNSGEIGLVKIIKKEKYKGMTRVYFKCGKRAFEDYVKKQNIVSTLVKSLSTSEGELLSKIASDGEKIKELTREINEFKNKLAIFEGEKLKLEKADDIIMKIYEDKSFDEVQRIGECLTDEKALVILTSKKDKKLFVLNSSGKGIDLSKLFKENLKQYDGKGGGNKVRVQATFNSETSIESFIEEVILKNAKN